MIKAIQLNEEIVQKVLLRLDGDVDEMSREYLIEELTIISDETEIDNLLKNYPDDCTRIGDVDFILYIL